MKGECEVVYSGFDLGSCCEVRSVKSAQAVPTIYVITNTTAPVGITIFEVSRASNFTVKR